MTIKENIEKWSDETRFRIVDEYRSSGREASGEFGNSVESTVIETPKGYNIKITGAKQAYWMENGRQPGKFPPIDAIRKWVKDKGIVASNISENSLSFLIARKIADNGYAGKPLISAVFTDAWINELLKPILVDYAKLVKSDVIKSVNR